MNDYITLDSYKYKTSSKSWHPVVTKPGTARPTLAATMDVTYGPGAFKRWQGELVIPVDPETGYGDIDDFKTTWDKVVGVPYTDHFGNTYTVHMFGTLGERSLSPRWDANSNHFFVNVLLVAE